MKARALSGIKRTLIEANNQREAPIYILDRQRG